MGLRVPLFNPVKYKVDFLIEKKETTDGRS